MRCFYSRVAIVNFGRKTKGFDLKVPVSRCLPRRVASQS
jgi:hypothetical protein